MASQLIREWVGIQQFPASTQTKLLDLLGKLKHEVPSLPFPSRPVRLSFCHPSFVGDFPLPGPVDTRCARSLALSAHVVWPALLQNVSTLTVLVMGKGGVGKSSTVNSVVGERVVAVSAFQVVPCVLTVSTPYECLNLVTGFGIAFYALVGGAETHNDFALEGWVYAEHRRHSRAHRRRIRQRSNP